MKKISVIVPCHNAVQWLPQCFLSLTKQTIGIGDLELIFVDDASDDMDQTWEMLEQFERAFPESVMIIRLEENLRQGGARNVGITYASGEYLAFVDADDFVAEDFFEKVYREAVLKDADIVQFEYYYYTNRGIAVPSGRAVKEEVLAVRTPKERKSFLMSEKVTYGCWNKIYRRDMVEKAGVRYAEHVIYEEPLFVYPLLFCVGKVVILEDMFYYYRQNLEGTMRRDMRDIKTLRMHARVQYQVWDFVKHQDYFEEYYEEIKLYFLHSFFYETLFFAKKREFDLPFSFYCELEQTIKREVPDYTSSKYAPVIPLQMELYRLACEGMTEQKLAGYMEKL